jgi:hypothetical protein
MIVACESLPKSRREAMRPAAATDFSLFRRKFFSPRLQCDTGHFQNALRSARLTRGGFLRHCLACGRALQNCVRRASQLTHNLQTTANSQTTREAAPAREAFTARRPRAHSRGFHQRIGG